MIRINVTGDLSPLVALVDRLSRPDLMPLAEKIRGRMIDGNRIGLLAGTDADGRRTADLAQSTLEDPRRKGNGPARVPQGDGSRMIADFQVTPERFPNGSIRLKGEWPDTPWVKFHTVEDTLRGRPARDPVGIRPADQALIAADLRDFAATLIEAF